MVPGGAGSWPLLDEQSDPQGVARLIDWMRAMDKRVRIMASVCTGAAVLARCGFLDGLPPPPTTAHSAGCRSTARACCGTAWRAGSMRENT
jgi:putative intracellular protease/amidase